jgi:hypothetical protein
MRWPGPKLRQNMNLGAVRAKIGRSERLLGEVGRGCRRWIEGIEVGELAHTRDRVSGRHEWRLPPLGSPPEDLALILSDAAHNLRSALDHLVNRAAEASGYQPTDRDRLQFPTCGNRRAYDGNAKSSLRGLAEPFKDVILSSQPFEAHQVKHLNLLESLGRLSDTDKHRDVHPVAWCTRSFPQAPLS